MKQLYSQEQKSIYNPNKDFTTLACWKDSRNVKLFFYQEIIPVLPGHEKFNLINQIQKASCSITANIAEGYGRYHYQEGLQFYRISRGSLYELKDHLISTFDLNYSNREICTQGNDLIEKAKISLNGYIRFVKEQKKKLENRK